MWEQNSLQDTDPPALFNFIAIYKYLLFINVCVMRSPLLSGNDSCRVPSLNLMCFTGFPELQLFLFVLFVGLADSRVSAKHPK